MAAKVLQEFHLFLGFHPFRNGLKPKAAGQRHDCACYGGIVGVVQQTHDKGLVYFDLIEWQAF